MAHEWAYRLQPALRAARVPVLLWYAHGSVTWRLRLAHRCVDRVVTSSPEGFRLPSAKRAVIGQAIDTRLFDVPAGRHDRHDVLYVGRLSPRKRVERLVEGLAALRATAPTVPVRLRLAGPPLGAEGDRYVESLRALAGRLGVADAVEIVGFVPPADVPALYRTAFLHANVSHTGSMDKTVLEALACGCPVVTSNVAFRELLAGRPDAFLGRDDPDDVARAMLRHYERRHEVRPAEWRALVVGRHDLDGFMRALMRELEALRPAPSGAPALRSAS
jgi:glycosyltransferase involved in cell wall biosynthesis